MNHISQYIIGKAHAQELIRCPDGTQADPSIGCVQTPSTVVRPEAGIAELILGAATALMTVVIIAATIGLIYGGIMYAIAAGDELRINRAKRIFLWSIVGLVIGLSARVIAQFALSSIA